MPSQGTPDWEGLAARIDALSDDLMSVASHAPDDLETTMMELQALSFRHYAIRLRAFED
jgi:hypothetical protein